MPRNRIHTLSDGRYTYTIRDASGSRRRLNSKVGEGKRAFSLRCEALDLQSKGIVSAETFDHLFEQWKTMHLEANCSAGEAKNAPNLYERYVKPYIGHRRLSDITRADMFSILTEGQDRGLSAGTLIKIRGCVSRPFNWAINSLGMQLIAPTAGLRFSYKKPEEKDRRRRALTDETVVRIFEAASESKYFSCFRLMLLMGLRPSEALALQINDVKIKHLEIRRGMTMYGLSPQLKTSAAWRDIPLTAETRQILLELIQSAAFRTQKGWLFPSECGEPSMNALKLAFDRVIRSTGKYECGGRNGLKKLRLLERPVEASMYDFRHTFATRMASAKMPHATLKQIMGHADIKTTLTYYIDVTDEMLEEAIRLMSV